MTQVLYAGTASRRLVQPSVTPLPKSPKWTYYHLLSLHPATQVAAHADPTRPARVEGQDSTSRNTQPAEAEQDGEHQAGHEKEGEGDGLHRGLAGEVAEELAEVGDLWRRRVARDVGLPGLVVQQDAGGCGGGVGGKGRRVNAERLS